MDMQSEGTFSFTSKFHTHFLFLISDSSIEIVLHSHPANHFAKVKDSFKLIKKGKIGKVIC